MRDAIAFARARGVTILIVTGRILDELARRGVRYRAGRSLVDAAAAADAPVVLDVVRSLELPPVLLFNKGRVMTMPQGVSKGTGLHAALGTLEPFVDRGDFSRWIRDVFGDHALAAELRAIESRHRGRIGPDTIPDLIDAIRARYDLREDALVPHQPASV